MARTVEISDRSERARHVAATQPQTVSSRLCRGLVRENPSAPPSIAPVSGQLSQRVFLSRASPRDPICRGAWTEKQNTFRPSSSCHSIRQEDCSSREATDEDRSRPLLPPREIAFR